MTMRPACRDRHGKAEPLTDLTRLDPNHAVFVAVRENDLGEFEKCGFIGQWPSDDGKNCAGIAEFHELVR